jgi:putrescine transport system substrate-binding protein
MKIRLLASVLAALLATPALAQDNVLHVYNWSDYIAEDTVAKFEAETGIKVVYDVYDSNDTLEAKLLAGSSGYDVVVPTSSFMQRQILADVYAPLDKSKIPNLKNLDPALDKIAETYDPGNEHGVIYMWGTIGIGYNKAKVEERLGADAPVNSWDLVFKPEYASRLADCGIAMLDSSSDMLQIAAAYLGLDPLTTSADDMEKATELLMTVRPYIRYFNSSQYISDLANGEICVAVGYSGDVYIAAARANEAKTGAEIVYSLPKEGSQVWFDLMGIPADAPNPEAAYKWMNFILEPKITADITNYVSYANANPASMEFVDEAIKSDPAIFPPPEVMAKLFPTVNYSKIDRQMTRFWTRVRTGK